MGWQVRKCIPQVKEDSYDSPRPGSPNTRQVSIICLWKERTGLGCGDSAPGHHSLASRLLKQRVRSGSQGMARMPQSNGRSKPSRAWSSETYPKTPPNHLYPHDLGGILNSKGELWLSDSHLLKYKAQLLGGTETTLRTCQSLNPASLLPEAEGNPEHLCEEVLKENYAARPDLTDRSLKIPDLELYTDGSSFVKNGVRHARFAVVTEFGTLKSGPLPPNTSAQLAELVALTEAVRLSKKQSQHLYRF
jgi:hypothetical protein